MLYRFNNNLINVTEISSVCSTKGSNRDYPYDLTVRMKDVSVEFHKSATDTKAFTVAQDANTTLIVE